MDAVNFNEEMQKSFVNFFAQKSYFTVIVLYYYQKNGKRTSIKITYIYCSDVILV